MIVNPRKRFTHRVTDYLKGRPGYPTAIVDELCKLGPLTKETIVADIGSGTGLSAELFLNARCCVFAVEPNEAMRREAERRFKDCLQFTSIVGSAEETTLPNGSTDWIVSAQSFHWFDFAQTRIEFNRILKPNGHFVLMWNERLKTGNTLAESYGEFIERYRINYTRVRHENMKEREITAFFGEEPMFISIPHEQHLDWEGLLARVRSSSYMPVEGANADAMCRSLRDLFERCQTGGEVVLRYECKLYAGRLKIS